MNLRRRDLSERPPPQLASGSFGHDLGGAAVIPPVHTGPELGEQPCLLERECGAARICVPGRMSNQHHDAGHTRTALAMAWVDAARWRAGARHPRRRTRGWSAGFQLPWGIKRTALLSNIHGKTSPTRRWSPAPNRCRSGGHHDPNKDERQPEHEPEFAEDASPFALVEEELRFTGEQPAPHFGFVPFPARSPESARSTESMIGTEQPAEDIGRSRCPPRRLPPARPRRTGSGSRRRRFGPPRTGAPRRPPPKPPPKPRKRTISRRGLDSEATAANASVTNTWKNNARLIESGIATRSLQSQPTAAVRLT